MRGRRNREAEQAFASCPVKRIQTYPGREHRTKLFCPGSGSGLVGESYLSADRAATNLARTAGRNACSSCVFAGKTTVEINDYLAEQALSEARLAEAKTALAETQSQQRQRLSEIALRVQGALPEQSPVARPVL